MDYLQHCIDLRRQDIEPELFALALAIRYIRDLINHGGSERGRPDFEVALHPESLEAFLARAVETTSKDARLAREWRQLQQLLPQAREAWEKGQALFREDLERAKSDQERMGYLSLIDFAVDCYAEVAASCAYPDNRVLQNWVINGYMLAWRQHFLADSNDLTE